MIQVGPKAPTPRTEKAPTPRSDIRVIRIEIGVPFMSELQDFEVRRPSGIVTVK